MLDGVKYFFLLLSTTILKEIKETLIRLLLDWNK